MLAAFRSLRGMYDRHGSCPHPLMSIIALFWQKDSNSRHSNAVPTKHALKINLYCMRPDAECVDRCRLSQSSIDAEGFRSLRENEPVEFVVEEGEDGRTKAVHVTGPDGAPPQVRAIGRFLCIRNIKINRILVPLVADAISRSDEGWVQLTQSYRSGHSHSPPSSS